MQAFQIDGFGDLDGIVLRERDQPEPGPGEVLVRVRSRSLNFRDLLILNQQYPVPARAGVVPLSDGAGEVIAVGPGVSQVKIGERVMASYFPRWLNGRFAPMAAMQQFGCTRDGMLAEAVLADESALVRVPTHLSFDEAATLPCAALTAWSALTRMRQLTPGDAVLTIGTGGVALFAVQFAKLFGARVVSVTSSAVKAARLEQLGADVVVDSSRQAAWAAEVREATSGRGVDHVVETGGLDSLPLSLASCAPEGQLALVAALGKGSLDAAALGAPVTIRRIYVGSFTGFEAMTRAVALHQLRPVIDTTFPFADAVEAYRHFAAKLHIGKVVIGG